MEVIPEKIKSDTEMFDPKKIDTYFTNVDSGEGGRFPIYFVKDQWGNHTGEISYLGTNGWTIYVDNCPGQKKYFTCNYPVNTLEQFTLDMERTGLKLLPIEDDSLQQTNK